MLQPVVRKTWSIRGQTPVHDSWDRHERLSAISAITVSPKRKRLGLYFQIHQKNITTFTVVLFILLVALKLRRPILLVLDRWSVHRAAVKWLQRLMDTKISIEWLPAYAPELNPVESVWAHSKHSDMANFIPDDVTDLHAEMEASIERKANNQTLLRSFFNHAQLPL